MRASETFFNAYVTCALWSSNDWKDESGGEPLDLNYGTEDIAPKALARMRADCNAFVRENKALLAIYHSRMGNEEWPSEAQAGHGFWLTRNGHGAGFWDRGLGKLGDRLSDAAKTFGVCDIYVGDDGRLHVS
jgi:hypothetical protein